MDGNSKKKPMTCCGSCIWTSDLEVITPLFFGVFILAAIDNSGKCSRNLFFFFFFKLMVIIRPKLSLKTWKSSRLPTTTHRRCFLMHVQKGKSTDLNVSKVRRERWSDCRPFSLHRIHFCANLATLRRSRFLQIFHILELPRVQNSPFVVLWKSPLFASIYMLYHHEGNCVIS